MKRKLSIIGIFILLLLVAIFSISNMQKVKVDFIFSKIDMPLVVLLICSLLIGALIVILFTMTSTFKTNRKIRHLNKQVKHLKKKVVAHEAEPTNDHKENEEEK